MTIGGLTWDDTGNRYYYTGIDGVAIYVWDDTTGWYGAPVAWNGVTAINENPSGAESNKLYADNIEYLNLLSKEEFGCTIECYQTPKDKVYTGEGGYSITAKGFDWCNGIRYDLLVGKVKVYGQPRVPFGLVYRVQEGSDTASAGSGDYIYHIVYGCKAAPSSQDHSTVNDSPEAQTFSYEITTTPLTDDSKFGSLQNDDPSIKSIAHMSFKLDDETFLAKGFDELFYGIGSQGYPGHMPTPNEIYDVFDAG